MSPASSVDPSLHRLSRPRCSTAPRNTTSATTSKWGSRRIAAFGVPESPQTEGRHPETRRCAAAVRRSRKQQQLSHRLARFQIAMCICGFGQAKSPADWHLELVLAGEPKYVVQAAAMDLMHCINHRHREPAYLQRLAEQAHRIQRIGDSSGAAVKHQMPERRKTLQPLCESGLADRVEDEIDAATIRESHRLRGEVVSCIIDDVVGAEFAHEADFVLARDCPNAPRAGGFRNRDGGDADSARRRMNDHGLSRRRLVTAMEQV